jgi:hypothetical protein
MVDRGCAEDVSCSESNLWVAPAQNAMCHGSTAALLKAGLQAEQQAGLQLIQRIMLEGQVLVEMQVHRGVGSLTAIVATASDPSRTGRCGLILCPQLQGPRGALPKRTQVVFCSGRMTR